MIVKYEYDAWGKVVAETDANGNALTGSAENWSKINPFRYRGYYYDSEVELYYLNSRFYDAETGRFINADDSSVITASPNALTDKNLFSYCDNNPVVRVDAGGNLWTATTIAACVGACVGGITSALSTASTAIIPGSDVDFWDVFMSGICGAATGALTVIFPTKSVVINGGFNAFESAISDIRKEKDVRTILTNATISFGFGMLSGSQGSSFTGKGGDIVANGVNSWSYRKTGNHPKVKGKANDAYNAAKKYVNKTFLSNLLEETPFAWIEEGVRRFADLFTKTLFKK